MTIDKSCLFSENIIGMVLGGCHMMERNLLVVAGGDSAWFCIGNEFIRV